MLRVIAVVLLNLGWLLLYANATHFELVTDVKQLPRIKRFIFWLRGRKTFWNGLHNNYAQMPNMMKEIPPKKHWRTEKTPIVIGIALILIGAALSLL